MIENEVVATLKEVRIYAEDDSDVIVAPVGRVIARATGKNSAKALARKVADIGNRHGLSFEERPAMGTIIMERVGTVWELDISPAAGGDISEKFENEFVDCLVTYLAYD